MTAPPFSCFWLACLGLAAGVAAATAQQFTTTRLGGGASGTLTASAKGIDLVVGGNNIGGTSDECSFHHTLDGQGVMEQIGRAHV